MEYLLRKVATRFKAKTGRPQLSNRMRVDRFTPIAKVLYLCAAQKMELAKILVKAGFWKRSG
jgi:hypothetical protein